MVYENKKSAIHPQPNPSGSGWGLLAPMIKKNILLVIIMVCLIPLISAGGVWTQNLNASNISTTNISANIISQTYIPNNGDPLISFNNTVNNIVSPLTITNTEATLNWKGNGGTALPNVLSRFRFTDNRNLTFTPSRIDYMRIVDFIFDRTADFYSSMSGSSVAYNIVYDFEFNDKGTYNYTPLKSYYKLFNVHGNIVPVYNENYKDVIILADIFDFGIAGSGLTINPVNNVDDYIPAYYLYFNIINANFKLTSLGANDEYVQIRGLDYNTKYSNSAAKKLENYAVYARVGNIALATNVRVTGNAAQKDLWRNDGGKLRFGTGTASSDIVNYTANVDLFYDNQAKFHIDSGLNITKFVGINLQGFDTDFYVTGKTKNTTFYVDWNTNSVGINQEFPKSILDVTGSARIGDSTTNIANFTSTGSLTFEGTARHNWKEYIPAVAGMSKGTVVGALSTLQKEYDGNYWTVTEATGSPGIDMTINFTGVTAFNWALVKAAYTGSATHSVVVQFYNWSSTSWNTQQNIPTSLFSSTTNSEVISRYDITIRSDKDYIGTGGDVGKVCMRLLHPVSGSASHNLYIDFAALYQ